MIERLGHFGGNAGGTLTFYTKSIYINTIVNHDISKMIKLKIFFKDMSG